MVGATLVVGSVGDCFGFSKSAISVLTVPCSVRPCVWPPNYGIWILLQWVCYGIAMLNGPCAEYTRNIFGGCAFTSYGGFWMGFALFEILMVITELEPPSKDGKAVWLCVWGLFTLLNFIGTLNANRVVQFVFASLTTLFFLLAAGVDNHDIHVLAGYVGIVCGSSALYLGWAEVMNELAGRELCYIGPVKNKVF